MPDYSSVAAKWEAVCERKDAFREAVGFWSGIIEGWMRWKVGAPEPLGWSDGDQRRRVTRRTGTRTRVNAGVEESRSQP